jgi:hypothetical protein
VSDKDVDQQEPKSTSWVRYKLTKKGKITLTMILSLLAIECVIFILMGLSIINGPLSLILIIFILIQVLILIPLIILMIEIYNFNQINNKNKRKKSIKEEYFVAGLIVGIFLGILWSGLFK